MCNLLNITTKVAKQNLGIFLMIICLIFQLPGTGTVQDREGTGLTILRQGLDEWHFHFLLFNSLDKLLIAISSFKSSIKCQFHPTDAEMTPSLGGQRRGRETVLTWPQVTSQGWNPYSLLMYLTHYIPRLTYIIKQYLMHYEFKVAQNSMFKAW